MALTDRALPHTQYVETVLHAERDGLSSLDNGDTPVFPASALPARSWSGRWTGWRRSCAVTAAGMIGGCTTHADSAAGLRFNDLGVVIETLRSGTTSGAWPVDIDVHHGDGVFYAYDDPDLIFADIHEDGRYLYPGTGHARDGPPRRQGTKLNSPLPAPATASPQHGCAWSRTCAFEPPSVRFQCGADGLDGDPLAHLTYTPQVHAHAAAAWSTSLTGSAPAPDGVRRRVRPQQSS